MYVYIHTKHIHIHTQGEPTYISTYLLIQIYIYIYIVLLIYLSIHLFTRTSILGGGLSDSVSQYSGFCISEWFGSPAAWIRALAGRKKTDWQMPA